MRPFFPNVPAEQPGATVHRRVEITFEREVISVLRHPSASGPGWCKRCDREVAMLAPEEAAAISGRTPREIYRCFEEETLHFEESSAGAVRVCAESLQQLLPASPALRLGPFTGETP